MTTTYAHGLLQQYHHDSLLASSVQVLPKRCAQLKTEQYESS
jgi:hypothetical protein